LSVVLLAAPTFQNKADDPLWSYGDYGCKSNAMDWVYKMVIELFTLLYTTKEPVQRQEIKMITK